MHVSNELVTFFSIELFFDLELRSLAALHDFQISSHTKREDGSVRLEQRAQEGE